MGLGGVVSSKLETFLFVVEACWLGGLEEALELEDWFDMAGTIFEEPRHCVSTVEWNELKSCCQS